MGCKNNLERQEEELQPGQQCDKRILSPNQEWTRESMLEGALLNILDGKEKGGGMISDLQVLQ